MNDDVGARQREPGAAGLQADEEDLRLAALELVDRRRAVDRRARQLRVDDLPLLEARREESEHARELREDEDAVPTFELLLEQLEEHVVFRRVADGHRGAHTHEARVAAHLTQLRERAENRDGRCGHALLPDEPAHLGMGRDANALVELALRTAQLDRAHHLRLRRELLRDVALQSAEDVRGDQLAKRHETLLVPALLDRHAIEATEVHLVAEETRVGEVEQRPELAEVVLDRRAREAEPVLGVDRPRREVRLAAHVLDRLRLVEDHHVIGGLRDELLVTAEDRVARDDDVRARGVVPRAVAAVEHVHPQARRELGDLAVPVRHEGRRRDDERGAIEATLLLLREEMRDGLERLAEAHVVGEDAADAARPQVLEPGEALDLVRTERSDEAGRRLRGTERRRDELLGPGAGRAVAAHREGSAVGDERLFEREERGRAHLGELDLPLLSARAFPELREDAEESTRALGRHGEIEPVADGKRETLLRALRELREALAVRPLDELDQGGEQVDAATVEIDAELEAEPVRAIRRLAVARDALDVRVPGGLAIDDAERIIRGDLDVPTERPELRNDIRAEGAKIVNVALAADGVVGVDRRGPVVEAVERHGAEALEEPAGPRLAVEIAELGLALVLHAVGVGGEVTDAVVLEGELEERDLLGLEHGAEALGPMNDDVVGEEPDAGDARDGPERLVEALEARTGPSELRLTAVGVGRAVPDHGPGLTLGGCRNPLCTPSATRGIRGRDVLGRSHDDP